jgi:histidyl-tRNA synthetase
MSDKDDDNITTDAYKGVRDFYPEDEFVQDYIFFVWESVLESFGYEKYHASILEPSALYEAKSGQEIVTEQTYNFTDRGDRHVTLRPEMTPTVARMVAGRKRDLTTPLRWFSIPNLFRYERPQRGRLREHWQLNADIFGVAHVEAEVEMIEIAATIMSKFGLTDTQFEIKINDIAALDVLLEEGGLNEIEAHQYKKLLDKRAKMDKEKFDTEVQKILGDKKAPELSESEAVIAIKTKLALRGISNVSFAPEIVRGFDYYTGVVFEVFSTDESNNRSLFGGGRYDDLLSIFGEEKMPAVGFGMGDVTIKDVLETYNLLPRYTPSAQLAVCPLNDSYYEVAAMLAGDLRKEGLHVSVDFSGKKVGEQIKRADKKRIPFVICLGEDEVHTNKFEVKELTTGKSTKMKQQKIAQFVKKNSSY